MRAYPRYAGCYRMERGAREAETGRGRCASRTRPDAGRARRVFDELRDGDAIIFDATLDHPASDSFWHPGRKLARYANPRGPLATVALRHRRAGAIAVDVRSRHATIATVTRPDLEPRLRIGDQCFAADLGPRCRPTARGVRCR